MFKSGVLRWPPALGSSSLAHLSTFLAVCRQHEENGQDRQGGRHPKKCLPTVGLRSEPDSAIGRMARDGLRVNLGEDLALASIANALAQPPSPASSGVSGGGLLSSLWSNVRHGNQF